MYREQQLSQLHFYPSSYIFSQWWLLRGQQWSGIYKSHTNKSEKSPRDSKRELIKDSPEFLNTGATLARFQPEGKHVKQKIIKKRIEESSGKQCFKTVIGMRSGPEAEEESSWAIIFKIAE